MARPRTLALVALFLGAAAAVLCGLAKAGVAWPWSLGRIHYTTWLEMSSAERNAVQAITVLGSPAGASVLCAAVAALAVRVGGMRAGLLVPGAAVVAVLTTVAKRVGPDSGVPSGHTAFAVAMLGLAAWLCARESRRLAAVVAAFLAAAMGPLRVLEGAHAPIDVIAGGLLGLAWLAGLLAATGGGRTWRPPERRYDGTLWRSARSDRTLAASRELRPREPGGLDR